jgi:hypothetical protein
MAALLTGHGRRGFSLRVREDGAVQPGDDVVKVATGLGRMTVATVNALLYLDRRPDPELLQRALRIRALGPGWRASLLALLHQHSSGTAGGGNAGLTALGRPPAWPRFRTLRVVAKRAESATVLSLDLEADDGLCHSCETGLLAGEVSYAPEPLEPAAAGNLLACCSQPRSDLAVDL